MTEYSGPEVYPPATWMDQCKALVPNSTVFALLDDWSWLTAWESGFTPTHAVACALLDVLAPEVGALYPVGGPR